MSTEFSPDEAMPEPVTAPESAAMAETQTQPEQPETPEPIAQPQPEAAVPVAQTEAAMPMAQPEAATPAPGPQPMLTAQPEATLPAPGPQPMPTAQPAATMPAPEPMPQPMPMSQPQPQPMQMPMSQPQGAEGNPAFYQYPVAAPGTVPAPKRRGVFIAAWLVSALAVGTGAGFGILAATGTSKSSTTSFGLPATASPTPTPTPSPSVTSGVRPDGTHYGSVKDFLLPIPDGYKAGPDEGNFGNDGSIPADQADPTVELLFGKLPASDMSTAQGALTSGRMSDGAVRTYESQAANLDISVTVLRLDPAQSAESTKQFESVVKLSRAFRSGPTVPGHPDALCVLPATAVGETLDGMICLGTVGDTFTVARAEGAVPLDASAVTKLFGRQLDLLKGGLGS